MKFVLFSIGGAAAVIGGCSQDPAFDDPQDWRLGETAENVAEPLAITPDTEGADGSFEFALYVPAGVNRSEVMLAGARSLRVGASVELRAPDASDRTTVFGMEEVEVGAEAQVGRVYGQALTIDERARVREPIGAGGSAIAHHWTVAFPIERAGAIQFDANQQGTVSPGAYESLAVGSDAVATLTTGIYHFDELTIAPEGVLELDNTAGPVYLWIRDSLMVYGTMVHAAPAPNVLVGYAGTTPPMLDGGFRGVLVAPNATLHLPAVDGAHVGSFFAQSIEVGEDTLIYQVPFLPNVIDYTKLVRTQPGGAWVNPLRAPDHKEPG